MHGVVSIQRMRGDSIDIQFGGTMLAPGRQGQVRRFPSTMLAQYIWLPTLNDLSGQQRSGA
eukprot:5809836-Pyramimonas_sp.AAC.1